MWFSEMLSVELWVVSRENSVHVAKKLILETEYVPEWASITSLQRNGQPLEEELYVPWFMFDIYDSYSQIRDDKYYYYYYYYH